MGLAVRLSISDALFQDILGLFYKLPMQIDGVPSDPALCIVLPKDKVRSLLVICVGRQTVSLSFFRELMSICSITSLVGIVRLTD